MTEDATDGSDMTENPTDSTDASTRDREDDAADDDRTGRDDDRNRTDRDRRGSGPDRGRATGGFFGGNDLYERLQWVALVVLVLVAVATLFSFYTNVTRLISIWATRKYEPAIQAAFALAVLASALAGIVALSRNLR